MPDISWFPPQGFMDFAGGYNSRLHSPKLQPTEGRYSEHVTYEFGRMKKDKGYKNMFTSAITDAAVTGIFYFPNLDKKVVAAGNSLKFWNDVPTPMTTANISHTLGDGLTSNPARLVSAVPFYDSTLGDIAVFTNGIDTPRKWTGTTADIAVGIGTATVVANAPKARFVGADDQRLIWGNINNGADSGKYQIQWSALDDAEDYSSTGSGVQPVMEDGTGVQGIVKADSGFLVPTEETWWRFIRTGDAKSPYRREKVKSGIGCDAPFSIATHSGITYFVHRATLYMTDGTEFQPLSDRTKDILFGIRPELRGRIYGDFSPDYKEYWLLMDYQAETQKRKILIYNLEQDVFKMKDCPANVVSAVKMHAFSTWNKIDLSYDEMWDYTWVDPRLYADFKHFITGGYNGMIQRHYWSDQKNGATLEGWHITKWFNFEELGIGDRYKRINALSFLLDKLNKGSFKVYYIGAEQAIPREGVSSSNWTLAGTVDNTIDTNTIYFQSKAYKNFCFKIGNDTDKAPFSIQGWKIGMEVLGDRGF